LGLKIKTSEFVVSATTARQLPEKILPEIAFVGRSNVGKSSLINLLLGRKALAKISGKPGKTRLVNYFEVNENIHFVDLPGYGFAKTNLEMRADWARMIEEYLTSPRQKLVLQLVDIRHGLTKLDLQSVEWLCYNMIPVAIVCTKSDKLSRPDLEKALESVKKQLKPFPVKQVISTSSKSRGGRDELLGFLDVWLKKNK
jgi:GTP-binding protein